MRTRAGMFLERALQWFEQDGYRALMEEVPVSLSDAKDHPMEQVPERCSIPCNLCGRTNVSVLSKISRSGRPLRTVICKLCGLVWSDPRPSNIRRFYEEDYRLSYKHTYVPKQKHILRAGKVALSRLEKIGSLLTSHKTVLDVGTGGGEFAYLLQSLGHEVSGVEPNKGYADYSVQEYGLTVRVGFIQDSAFPCESFDLITTWHVLEHTENPGAVLAQLRSWLKPGGMLVVEVPNVEATCQSPKSTFHEAHLYNFNVVSLRALAKKQGLQEAWHLISRDGGIITMFLQHSSQPSPKYDPDSNPGNYEWISTIVRGNTNWRRHLTSMPYVRVAQRLYRSLVERRDTAGALKGRELLDHLYAKEALAHSLPARP